MAHPPGHGEKRAEIEGLRAVAVVLVLLYHLHVGGLGGGYVGVDAFFVVSGFLITGLLAREITTGGNVRLHEFWARRMRRIMPMALLVVVLTVVFGYLVLEPGRKDELMPIALGAVGFCANIVLFYRTDDYLAGATLPSPMQHYWSLGVEEQFYLVWPLLVWVIARLARGRWKLVLGIVCVLLLAGSLAESVRVSYHDHGAGYFLPQTRVWELLIGAALSLVVVRLPKVLAGAIGWLGLAAIFFAALTFDEETVFPGWLALIPVLGAAAVILAADSPWGPHPILRQRPLQLLGLWSFSLYLLHFPVIVLVEARWGVLSGVGQVLVGVVCVAASALTYRLVEAPVRWNPWLSARPRRTVLASFAALALLLSTGVTVQALRSPSATDDPGFAVPSGIDPGSLDDLLDDVGAAADTVPSAIGTDAESTVPVTMPPVKPVRALLLGDSTMAEMRWYEQGQVGLSGFTYVLDAEACRRLSYPGCEGREHRTPKSARSVVLHLQEHFDVIVLQAGYHGKPGSFRDELKKFADVVARTGSKLVILSLKESLRYPEAGSKGTRSVYTTLNAQLRDMVAAGELGDATIADWNLFSYSHPEWFRPDGIHTNLAGTAGLGWFISMTIAAMYDNPCPFEAVYPCVVPPVADPAFDPLAMFGLVNTDMHCYEDGPRRKRVCEPDRRMD